MTRFVLGAVTVQFNADPVKPGGEAIAKRQQVGRDGEGDLYVYDKATLRRHQHRLQFSSISGAVRTALLSFIRNQAVGVKNSFSWFDQDDVERSVRFEAPEIKLDPAGPDRFSGEIILIEDL